MDNLATTKPLDATSGFPLDGAIGSIELSELLTLWRETDLSFTLKLSGANPHEPSLIGALRGTWGQFLMEQEAQGCEQACRLLNCVFRQCLPTLPEGGMITRPIVLETDVPDTATLVIRIRCFGFSDTLTHSIASSFPESLAKGVWIKGHRFRVGFENLTLTRREGLALEKPISTDRLTIRFNTPYVTGTHHSSPDPAGLLESISRRVRGVCRWHGFELNADRALSQAIHDTDIDMSAISLQSWLRHTNRGDKRRAIVMIGFSGSLVLSRPTANLRQLIACGARCHAGARTSFGLGRYDTACA